MWGLQFSFGNGWRANLTWTADTLGWYWNKLHLSPSGRSVPGIYYKLELFEDPMHLQIVNFKLNGISRTEYDAILADVSSVFPTIPGLKAKYFLADDEGNTYGGVYIWESQQAMKDYQSGEIFKGIQAEPAFMDVSSRDFAVIEAPTFVKE